MQHVWLLSRYTAGGFIVNDVTLQGGLLCMRNGFYSWDAAALDFSAVSLLHPLPGEHVCGCCDGAGGQNAWPKHAQARAAAGAASWLPRQSVRAGVVGIWAVAGGSLEHLIAI